MSSLSSKLKRVFLNKANLSDQVYKDDLQGYIEDFIEDRENGEFDAVIAASEYEGKFALVIIDQDNNHRVNFKAVDFLKKIWGSEYKNNLAELIPMIQEKLEDGGIFCTGLFSDEGREKFICRIVKEVQSRIELGVSPFVSEEIEDLIIEQDLVAGFILSFLDLLECGDGAEKAEVATYMEILTSSFSELRLRDEDGMKENSAQISLLLGLTEEILRQSESLEFGSFMMEILNIAKVTPSKELVELYQELCVDIDIDPEDAFEDLKKLIDAHECPYQILDEIFEGAAHFDAELRSKMLAILFQHENELSKEAACLTLLDKDPSVRQFTQEFLLNNYKHNVNGNSLRRLITIRNWLPEKEQKNIDKIIVRCKKANIPVAPLKRFVITDLFASIIDGSGSQGIWGLVKDGEKYLQFGLLFKLRFGFREYMVDDDLNFEQAEEFKSLIFSNSEVGIERISPECIQSIIKYYLCYHESKLAIPPGVELLKIIEILGSPVWSPEEHATDLVAQQDLTWEINDHIPESWLFEFQDTFDYTMRKKEKVDEKVLAILQSISAEEKERWLENFKISSILSFHCDAMELPSPQTLVNSMNALEGGVPLSDIPIMRKIANNTLRVANSH